MSTNLDRPSTVIMRPVVLAVVAILCSPALGGEYDEYVVALKSGSPMALGEAASHLPLLSKEAREEIRPLVEDDLIRHLRSEDAVVRVFAASALGDLNVQKAWIPLIAVVRDPESLVRANALEALWKIGGATKKEQVVALVKLMLADSELKAREGAVAVAEEMDPLPETLVPALATVLEFEDRRLTKADPEKLSFSRRYAIKALAHAGKKAAPATAALAKALGYHTEEVRKAAAQLLGNIGPKAMSAVGALVGALGDKSADVRAAAATAIMKIGPRDRDTARAIMKILDRGGNPERRLAADILETMGPAATKAAPLLRRALKSDDAALRLAAVKALGAIGPAAKSALRTLEKLAERDRDEIREAAQAAILKIRPE